MHISNMTASRQARPGQSVFKCLVQAALNSCPPPESLPFYGGHAASAIITTTVFEGFQLYSA